MRNPTTSQSRRSFVVTGERVAPVAADAAWTKRSGPVYTAQPAEPPPTPAIGEIRRLERLGGLVHENSRAAA
jgi:hypothetical protein